MCRGNVFDCGFRTVPRIVLAAGDVSQYSLCDLWLSMCCILEEHLQCGKIDFLLCHYPEQQSVGLRYLPLANETLYLVMARSCYNRISEERPDVFDQIPWDELQSLPFYLTQSYYRDRQLIDLALKDMNLEPVHVQELCSYYSIFGLVENDLGVTIAPSVNCQPFLQNEKLFL